MGMAATTTRTRQSACLSRWCSVEPIWAFVVGVSDESSLSTKTARCLGGIALETTMERKNVGAKSAKMSLESAEGDRRWSFGEIMTKGPKPTRVAAMETVVANAAGTMATATTFAAMPVGELTTRGATKMWGRMTRGGERGKEKKNPEEKKPENRGWKQMGKVQNNGRELLRIVGDGGDGDTKEEKVEEEGKVLPKVGPVSSVCVGSICSKRCLGARKRVER